MQAMESLKSNKLRSILTMLGIVMGVFSIITIMALGSATENYMNVQFERIGANTISITYKNMNVDRKDWLTLKDMDYVREAAPEIKNIATSIQKGHSPNWRQDKGCPGVWRVLPIQEFCHHRNGIRQVHK